MLWVAGAGTVGGDSDAARGPASGAGPGGLVGLRLDLIHAELTDGVLDGALHPVALAGCQVGPPPRPYPPEALLHAVVPAGYVAVTQPDAVMALCAAADGARLAQACFGEAAGWISYEATGAALARELGLAASEPRVRMALLARRGLVTWGESEQACHEATVAATRSARDFLTTAAVGPRCGGPTLAPLGTRERARLLACLLPVIRQALSDSGPKVLELDTSPDVLAFVCARDAPTLAQLGAVCSPQVVHTQRAPLWIDADPRCDHAGDLAERLVRGARRHRAHMRWELAAFGGDDAARVDPEARVVLIAGVGMVAAGATRTAARRARLAYRHAISTIGATARLDRYVAPSVAECAAVARALRGA